MPRGNKTIWRVAEWLYYEIACPPAQGDWNTSWPENKAWVYDKAAELMKKIQMNEFTGEDTHKD